MIKTLQTRCCNSAHEGTIRQRDVGLVGWCQFQGQFYAKILGVVCVKSTAKFGGLATIWESAKLEGPSHDLAVARSQRGTGSV